MAVNGSETTSDEKPIQALPPDGRSTRQAPATKSTPNGKAPIARRRRGQGLDPGLEGSERFFLAAPDGDGSVPAFGRECATEGEAIIEAFRARVNFYHVCEYGTRAELTASRKPVLQKEIIRRTSH